MGLLQSISTITSGLQLEELKQQINATNLSQTSVDSQGYLENSLQQVNSVDSTPVTYSGSNGTLSVGTGTAVESITRLRSSYLDSQIQQQSMKVGYNEILSNSSSSGILDQIKTIVDGSATLSTALSSFTSAWTTLQSDPTNVSDQTAVVNAGVSFATEANSEYSQLNNLQTGANSQITQTVSSINGLLQQIGSINQQLMTTGGSNQNSLLDARDYALDKLSRLTNYQVSYGTDGTANVWVGGVALVNGTRVSSLETNASNPNNSQLVDITVATYSHQTTGSATSSAYDISSSITGGNLGGELYARNVVLQSYKAQVDQVATSVMNATNNLYEAGYVANSTTTGSAFFSGTGASNIAVNGTLTGSSATSPFVATETTANASTGTLAGFLSNLGSLQAKDLAGSVTSIGSGADPTQSISSQGFSTTGGSFTLNGTTINYTSSDSINTILNKINTSDAGVDAVFNQSTGQFYFYSSSAINFTGVSGDKFAWANIQNITVSSPKMNNVSAPDPKLNVDLSSALNSTTATTVGSVVYGLNDEAFLVTPGTSGSFTVYYTNSSGVATSAQVSWNNNQSLATILNALPTELNYLFVGGTNSVEIISSSPIQVVDNSGNFTVFTGLNGGNTSLTNLASNVSSNASTEDSSANTTYTSSSDSLTQLNNEQANIAGVSSSSSSAGVSTSTLEEEAQEDLVVYNALLEVLKVIDEMLDSLVGASGSSTDGIFTTSSSG